MEQEKIYDKIVKLNNIEKKSVEIESYKKIIRLNEKLIERGLTKKRGYSLATIADKPYEYKGNN